MDKIIIGIDCDGVLRDFDAQIKYLAAQQGLTDIDMSNWNYLQKYKINGTPLNKLIWDSGEWARPLFTQAPVIEGALGAYQKFCNDERFTVNIVTSQKEGTEDLTYQWLSQNKFVIHNKTIVTSDKHKSGAQILIDDKPEHIQDHNQAGLKGILISRSYNLSWDYQPRTQNLSEAYQWITRNLKNIENLFLSKQLQ